MQAMKRTLASIIGLFLCIAQVSAQVPAQEFSDLPQTHSNYVAVKFLTTEGILKGYEDGKFHAENLVNRAEAIKIIIEGNKILTDAKTTEDVFKDVKSQDWFAKYIAKAKEIAIINGNPDGTFAPGRNVSRSEFIKMLLSANGFKKESWENQELFNDIPKGTWFTPYMNYAGQAGLLEKDEKNNLYPAKQLTRGEVAEIMYLLIVIKNGKDTQFLIDQAESQMAQIEIYIAATDPVGAKKASELAFDVTQQAYKNKPDDKVVLGVAKLAKAYDFLVNAYIMALQKKNSEAIDWANQAISKATEAWETNNDLQPLARHIKDNANKILSQMQTPSPEIDTLPPAN